jgi:hypothetical protein
VAVHLGEVELASVEDDLRVVVGDARVFDGHVTAAGSPDGDDLLVDREDLGLPRADHPFQARHVGAVIAL